jgi:hypothetical protein
MGAGMVKVGDRLELISMTDPYAVIKPYTQGVVTSIDDMGTIHVDWDDGGKLGLIAGEDRWRPVT